MPEARIVIVGGGAAGLAAAGALKHHGIESVILDRDEHTGDVWRNRYERLHLHTTRVLSHMPYYRIPKDCGRYPSKDDFAAYMEAYARHFDLDVRHGIEVTGVRKLGMKWHVEVAQGEPWETSTVIIATGLNREPYIPDWPNRDGYKGEFMHSASYSTGADFTGKRVLVIGSGNSGSEICADLVEKDAKSVVCSIRTTPTIVPRDPLGVPVQIWGVGLYALPKFIKDGIVQVLGRILLGDLTRFGLGQAEWKVFKDSRIPTIDVGFVPYLKQGKILIRGDITEFTENGVIFAGDTSEEVFDAVIAATGFRTGLQRLIDLPDVVDKEGVLQVPCGQPNHHKGLWFIGLENSPAGILLATRVQARGMAKMIERELQV